MLSTVLIQLSKKLSNQSHKRRNSPRPKSIGRRKPRLRSWPRRRRKLRPRRRPPKRRKRNRKRRKRKSRKWQLIKLREKRRCSPPWKQKTP